MCYKKVKFKTGQKLKTFEIIFNFNFTTQIVYPKGTSMPNISILVHILNEWQASKK